MIRHVEHQKKAVEWRWNQRVYTSKRNLFLWDREYRGRADSPAELLHSSSILASCVIRRKVICIRFETWHGTSVVLCGRNRQLSKPHRTTSFKRWREVAEPFGSCPSCRSRGVNLRRERGNVDLFKGSHEKDLRLKVQLMADRSARTQDPSY